MLNFLHSAFGINHHCAEFIDVESALVQPHSLLQEKHWAGRKELDQCGYRQKKRRQEHNEDQGSGDIGRALDYCRPSIEDRSTIVGYVCIPFEIFHTGARMLQREDTRDETQSDALLLAKLRHF